MKLTIVIPCLNEVSTIEKAVKIASRAARQYLKKEFEIIVADNGSTDGTLEKLAKFRSIKLIHVPIKGYGAALHYGILSAKYPYVFFADADLSYDFGELKKFLVYINKGYDLILGSRIRGKIEKGAMPFLNRYLGTPMLTTLNHLVYGIKASDCNSGMRAIKTSFYRQLKMKNSGMEWASELLIKTAINNGRYIELPINFYKDQRGKIPHLRRWEDGWRHLKVIILLKPATLVIFALILLLIGLIFLPVSLFTTIAMTLFAEFWLLSYLLTKKLEEALSREANPISSWLDRIPLVFIAVIVTFLGFLQLFIISDYHLFTKYILFFQMILFDFWLFFIETIKTHLIHPLPDKI
jgi:glycosyltransferase involved in cell wall biosynthesis